MQASDHLAHVLDDEVARLGLALDDRGELAEQLAMLLQLWATWSEVPPVLLRTRLERLPRPQATRSVGRPVRQQMLLDLQPTRLVGRPLPPSIRLEVQPLWLQTRSVALPTPRPTLLVVPPVQLPTLSALL